MVKLPLSSMPTDGSVWGLVVMVFTWNSLPRAGTLWMDVSGSAVVVHVGVKRDGRCWMNTRWPWLVVARRSRQLHVICGTDVASPTDLQQVIGRARAGR